MALKFEDGPTTAMSGQFSEIFGELESWYRQDHGSYALQQTREALRPHLDIAFGYHALQLGPVRSESLLEDSPINHCVFAGDRPGELVGLVCEGDQIPLESDSVDVIVAHHCLEFSDNPHQVLRELQRVLTPQGHLLLVGFNPISLRGLYTAARRLRRSSPWRSHQPVREGRLNDWLRLVGCEPSSHAYLCAVPQFGGGRVRHLLGRWDRWCRRHNLPVGSLYVVHAIKQVSAINPQRLGLRRRSEQLIGLVPKPRPAPSPAPNAPRGANAAPRTGDTAA